MPETGVIKYEGFTEGADKDSMILKTLSAVENERIKNKALRAEGESVLSFATKGYDHDNIQKGFYKDVFASLRGEDV